MRRKVHRLVSDFWTLNGMRRKNRCSAHTIFDVLPFDDPLHLAVSRTLQGAPQSHKQSQATPMTALSIHQNNTRMPWMPLQCQEGYASLLCI